MWISLILSRKPWLKCSQSKFHLLLCFLFLGFLKFSNPNPIGSLCNWVLYGSRWVLSWSNHFHLQGLKSPPPWFISLGIGAMLTVYRHACSFWLCTCKCLLPWRPFWLPSRPWLYLCLSFLQRGNFEAESGHFGRCKPKTILCLLNFCRLQAGSYRDRCNFRRHWDEGWCCTMSQLVDGWDRSEGTSIRCGKHLLHIKFPWVQECFHAKWKYHDQEAWQQHQQWEWFRFVFLEDP